MRGAQTPDTSRDPARSAGAEPGTTAVITGIGTAFPGVFDQQSLWDEVFDRRYRGDRMARRIFMGCGVRTRHGVVDPRREDISGWSTATRMLRYVEDAHPLGLQAVRAALTDAGLNAADVGLFVVVSCTGYSTPGLDIQLARELGMSAQVRRLLIGHMGCYAAIPGMGTAADFVRARRQPALVLCVELTSLHIQPDTPERDLEQVVAHALFGDAAAAIVLQPDAERGLDVIDTTAVTAPASEELMTWHVTDHGFRMGLSAKVPAVLANHVEEATAALLDPFELKRADVQGWAVHPGGLRIVDVVEERLGLDRAQTAATRQILNSRGNCSSATVLLVVEQLRDGLDIGGTAIGMAFGPGLTLCMALLRRR
ncbi:type III polyketide synthase [Parafrankia sp. BMG5.11]|uniref:type III polyketide synthase n=1 Tax=Parafrankia sp. BMG5.11 TaxID=222540 RepID=UPI000DA518AB|nr:Chalcone synthase [Frankia sp. Hr75.2]SQD96116.1 Chalcone synthase [Parafrankia sp. Ea1.12]